MADEVTIALVTPKIGVFAWDLGEIQGVPAGPKAYENGDLRAGGLWVHCPTLRSRRKKETEGNLMYAIFRTGGKQYRVSEGDTLRVEKIDGDVGAAVNFEEVLMLGGETVAVGQPTISGATVSAKITAQDKAKRIIVFKMKRRKNYRRKRGHRQPYTELKVTGISA